MNEIKISQDLTSYISKPSGIEVAKINNRIANEIEKYNKENINLLVKIIGENGCTFCPATFKEGKRKKENFEQLQLLTLDFDSGISFDEVKDRADLYELPILFAYDTLSSEEHNKFRVSFLNDVPIPDIRVADTMLTALHTIFPEADSSCNDVTRMFFGGKGILHFYESIPNINIESLTRNMCTYLYDKYGITNYKRYIEKFTKRTGVALNKNKLPDISVSDFPAEISGTSQNDKNSPSSSILISNNGDNLLKSYIINFTDECTKPLSPNKPVIHNQYRSDVLKIIRSCCQLYREFEKRENILHHDELFGLSTNLIQVESGAAKFKEIIKLHSYFDDRPEKYSNWNYYLGYNKSYKPASCSRFCPYHESCIHGKNILSTAKPKQIERIKNTNESYVSIEEAVEDFKNKLYSAINSNDCKWHIIKAQTALGKTYTYIELLKETSLKILIAVPTLILKNEVCERAKTMGIKIKESPSIREYNLPEYILSEINELYLSGKSLPLYLKNAIKEGHEYSDIFTQYLDELNIINKCKNHGITTHRRLLSMSKEDLNKYDLVIVDEDIIFNSI